MPDQPEECRGRDIEFSWNAEGEKGDTGDNGNTGDPGADGLSCWDLDGDGVQDTGEDANGDGSFDTLDCRGPEGPPGAGNAVVRSLSGTSAGCPNRGWCPGRQGFLILEPAVSASSVMLVNVLHGIQEDMVPCRLGGFALEFGGFRVVCDVATPETAILNYVVFNP